MNIKNRLRMAAQLATLNQKGFGIMEVGSLILTMLVLFICLPILEPFLADAIIATGGITALIIMGIPLAMVIGAVIIIFKPAQPRYPQF